MTLDLDAVRRRYDYLVTHQQSGMAYMDAAVVAADVPSLVAEVTQLRAEVGRLREDRLLSVIFGHHPGAPRPFGLYRPSPCSTQEGQHRHDGRGETIATGAEWDDGFALVRWHNTDGGPRVMTGYADLTMAATIEADARAEGAVVVWLSEELEQLSDMEEARDAALAELAELRAARHEFDPEPLIAEVERLSAELAKRPRVWRAGDPEPDDRPRMVDPEGDAWTWGDDGRLRYSDDGDPVLHPRGGYAWVVAVYDFGPFIEVPR